MRGKERGVDACTVNTSVKAIFLYGMENKEGIKINVLWLSKSEPKQVAFKLIHMGFELGRGLYRLNTVLNYSGAALVS